ncbi:DUF2085 domain-containing protein [Ktedonospora formicarum]|uniref:DUF2085 domain-containing protein n=1 Tax=Ktedonospora formicarum TaxID=2778364 RepID=A0A8J3MVE2_9CHLR|nr:DUF2085 domain-containing protein [Ktedonospora formicarum]GHO50202.1 hypothetical protein KSX_83650 [Ktedonospora formicarum]
MGKVVGKAIRVRTIWPWRMLLWVSILIGACVGLALWPEKLLIVGLRWLDSGICAHIPSHVFTLGGEMLPLCARDTGIYMGFCVSLIALFLTGRGQAQELPPLQVQLLLGSGVIALGIDGLNSLALDLHLPHIYQPSNLLRLATGLLAGLALAAFALPTFNKLVWRHYYASSSLASWRMILWVFLPLLLTCFLATASQAPILLYPLALLSTSGLLMAVSSINLMGIILARKRSETFTSSCQLVPYLGLALLLAIGELILLAQLHTLLENLSAPALATTMAFVFV